MFRERFFALWVTMTILLTHSTISMSHLCVCPHVPSILVFPFFAHALFLHVKMPQSGHTTHMGGGSLVTVTFGCKVLHLGVKSGHEREWHIVKHVFPFEVLMKSDSTILSGCGSKACHVLLQQLKCLSNLLQNLKYHRSKWQLNSDLQVST